MTRKIMVGLALLVLIGTLFGSIGCSAPSPVPEITPKPEEEPAPQVIELTVTELNKAWYGNQITAEEKYLNKTIHLSGKVGKIQRDINTGKASVQVYETIGNAHVFVKCVFDSEDEVASLSRAQKIVVEGKFVGKRLEGVMRLENCSLVE